MNKPIRTNGKASTEYALMLVNTTIGILGAVFLLIARNLLKWDISDAETLLYMVLGGNVAYAGGRSWFKAALAKSRRIEKRK